MTNKARTIVAVAAIMSAMACSSKQTYTAGGDVDVSMATPAELGSGEVTVLQQMSDANILGHLLALDSLEITMSDTALYHVKGDKASGFARSMHVTHEDNRKALKDLASSTGLIPTIDVARLRSSSIAAGLDSVRKGSDAAKDQQYLRTQVELHRHALAELQVLQHVAKNTALRQHVTAMIPVIRDHLGRAQMIARDLGAR